MPESMRIALFTHSVNPRGGVVHTLELARALHKLGHRVTVFAPAEPGQRLFRTLPCDVELIAVSPAPADVRGMVASRIAAIVAHLECRDDLDRFDVLHAQDSISGNALADLRARGRVSGFLRTVHHLDDFADPQLAAWQRRAWQDATQCLCVSDMWCERLRGAHATRVERVSNGVDTGHFNVEIGPRDAQLAERLELQPGCGPVFLAVGGVEARKNTVRILQAFLRLYARHPDARLLIAGGASLLDHSAYARTFQAVLAERGIDFGPGCAVHLTGPLPDADMPALYRLADVLVTPSLREGFGLVALEALACGTPLVAARIAPFTEYLDDALCHWAQPDDVDSISEAMERAATARRGQALREDASALLERHGWLASARRHVDLYWRHARTVHTTCTT